MCDEHNSATPWRRETTCTASGNGGLHAACPLAGDKGEGPAPRALKESGLILDGDGDLAAVTALAVGAYAFRAACGLCSTHAPASEIGKGSSSEPGRAAYSPVAPPVPPLGAAEGEEGSPWNTLTYFLISEPV